LVKGAPATIVVLSGIVTSVTKDAPFVQFGSFVGRGVSGVDVNCDRIGAGVSMATSVSAVCAGACVSVGSCVAVEVATGGGVAVCEAQPESKSVNNKIKTNNFPIILTSFAFHMRLLY
jgi:hypothetical protein